LLRKGRDISKIPMDLNSAGQKQHKKHDALSKMVIILKTKKWNSKITKWELC
jgi:hypothetical protein